MTDTPEKIIYTAVATATGGRSGRATSDDGVLDLPLARPEPMGGSGALVVAIGVRLPVQDEETVRELTEAPTRCALTPRATRGNVEVTLEVVAN